MISGVAAALALLAAQPGPDPIATGPAMDQAVRDLCHRQVALLGEASHGDGATLAFKVQLTRRLVDECGYNAVVFEASHYDFLEFSRRLAAHEPVTPAMISSSIGGLWNRFAEMTPLIRFLFDRAQAGRLTLGGLDDQIGSAGAFFSMDEMPRRLTAGLPAARREACRATFHRRLYWQYGEAVHHDEAEIGRLQACLADMAVAIARNGPAPERVTRLHMIASMQRAVAREFLDDAALTRGRDRSMFLNLRWLSARLGPRARTIIWAHNVHVARDASSSTSFPEGGNLGAFVHRAYGRRAFALGFSAAGGVWSSRFSRGERILPPAPPDALEAVALTGIAGDNVYRGGAWLAGIGRVPGRPFNYIYAPADWARAFDGLIVFRTERAPERNP